MKNSKQIDLSVIVPAFNEAERITPTLIELDEFLAASNWTYEIVVVDDGSSDNTTIVVDEIGWQRPAVRCVSYEQNRGKGHAVRIGMTSAHGRVRVMCDADGSMPASELPRLVGPVLADETDIAIGSRYAEGSSAGAKQPAWRRAWSRVANYIVRKSLVGGISDTQCGFKAFSAPVADAIFTQARIDGWAFDLEVLALARKMGFHVLEVGVHWTDDERSRVSPVKDAIGIAKEWVAIRRNLRGGVYDLRSASSRTLTGIAA